MKHLLMIPNETHPYALWYLIHPLTDKIYRNKNLYNSIQCKIRQLKEKVLYYLNVHNIHIPVLIICFLLCELEAVDYK